MNKYFQTAKSYVIENKKEFTLGGTLLLMFVVVAGIVGYVIYTHIPHIAYEPASACKLLTPAKAQTLLGDKVISTGDDEPTISGNIATSKCSYTDQNADETQMLVAALAVRAGINDDGVKNNKAGFAAVKEATTNKEDVSGIGDTAYFNKDKGQLNVLSGRSWLIVTYGAGDATEDNTLDDAVKLAKLIVAH